MPKRNARHLDKSMLLVLAVGLMSIQGCPSVGDKMSDGGSLPGLGTPKPTQEPANLASINVTDPSQKTVFASEAGPIAFGLEIPPNTLAKGRRVTLECALTPGSKIPADMLSNSAVKDRTLLFYFDLEFTGNPLSPGITNASFANPQPDTFPKDSSALLYFYNKASKGWEEAASFVSKGERISLLSGSISKPGPYCLYVDGSVAASPTPTPTPEPKVAAVQIAIPDVPVLGPPPIGGATPLFPSTMQLSATVTMNPSDATAPGIAWSIKPPGLTGVTLSSSGLVSVNGIAVEGEVIILASAGEKESSLTLLVKTGGGLDVEIKERRIRK
ncbi:MAG TPA: hypothetical protein DD435_06315 [Cyanobacteria bacterium UBA8530]|nr:hypothetical protein [Cyanobacteria bacterium UBA8530]